MIRIAIRLVVVAWPCVAWAQVTQRVSVNTAGREANRGAVSSTGRAVSADGRWFAFRSISTNLVAGDTNAGWDIFARDRTLNRTLRASVSSTGEQSNGFSGVYGVWISADGRCVSFESLASNLVQGDFNGGPDVFVHDLESGETELASVDSTGLQGDGRSFYPSLSGDGRYVAFTSDSTNLVPGDTNGSFDVFVHDRLTGATERVSLATGGAQAHLGGYRPVISGNGRFVAFESSANDLVPGDTNGVLDVFVHDRQTHATERVSVDSNGVQGDFDSQVVDISADGRFVAFVSRSDNLVTADTNGVRDGFVRDRLTGTTERVTIPPNGGEWHTNSAVTAISADGRYAVVGNVDIYVRDRIAGSTELASSGMGGIASDRGAGPGWISDDGRFVAFFSESTNLVPDDTNAAGDMFVRDRRANGFELFCEPGVGRVRDCPCSNPASGPGRGCENSVASGGATLSASGTAYLSMDSLAFSTSGEVDTALSVLLQARSTLAAGIAYGQGVRCLEGPYERLFSRSAALGRVNLPDIGRGDPSVSSRSSALGDVIRAGESRWYLVGYRDPTVLGGCASGSTFNSTPTGRVTWSP